MARKAAIIGGGVTVGVYVVTPFAPEVSSIVYVIGGGVPTKSGSGVNVITPSASTL
jgi:hypothetical protein